MLGELEVVQLLIESAEKYKEAINNNKPTEKYLGEIRAYTKVLCRTCEDESVHNEEHKSIDLKDFL